MKISAIRKLEEGSLQVELKKMYEDLTKSKEEIRLGKEKDFRKSLKIKRNIARMLTVLHGLNLKRQL